MQQLLDLIDGFSSAEILMALMLSAGSKKKDEDNNGAGALALLAGMALASQLKGGDSLNCGVPQINNQMGMSGMQLNITA
jgi:hypothetical protein